MFKTYFRSFSTRQNEKQGIKRMLNITRDIMEKVEIRRLRYIGHVTRMKQDRFPYIAMMAYEAEEEKGQDGWILCRRTANQED